MQKSNIKFLHVTDIVRYLEYLASKYPKLVELITIGNSYEGQPIKMVKVSVGLNKDGNRKPAIWIDAGKCVMFLPLEKYLSHIFYKEILHIKTIIYIYILMKLYKYIIIALLWNLKASRFLKTLNPHVSHVSHNFIPLDCSFDELSIYLQVCTDENGLVPQWQPTY